MTPRPRPTRGRPQYLRANKVTPGGVMLLCKGPLHAKPAWLHETTFRTYTQKSRGIRRIYRQTLCKHCMDHENAKRRAPHRRLHGRVDVERIRPFLYDIIRECGTYRAAAETLGINSSHLFRMLGRAGERHNLSQVTRLTALQILLTLRGIRTGQLEPVRGNVAKQKGHFQYGCKECGRPNDTPTPGCETCDENVYRRKRREDPSFRKKENARTMERRRALKEKKPGPS